PISTLFPYTTLFRSLGRLARRRCNSPGFPGPNYDRTWLDSTFSSKKETTKHTNDTKKKRTKEKLACRFAPGRRWAGAKRQAAPLDRKSTRLNSSHDQ